MTRYPKKRNCCLENESISRSANDRERLSNDKRDDEDFKTYLRYKPATGIRTKKKSQVAFLCDPVRWKKCHDCDNEHDTIVRDKLSKLQQRHLI